ncbi:MAG: SpoIIE family protein phosphatase [Polyangiales bacterium]
MTQLEASPAAQERALIVDDLSVNRLMLRALVQRESENIVIDEAADAPSALRLLVAQDYDVVLLDLNLGDSGDGLHVLRAMRCSPRFSTTPVILVSSREPDDSFIASALREGADDYVTRPVDARLLAARLANARRTRQRYVSLRNDALDALSRVGDSNEELRAAAVAQKALLPKVPIATRSVTATAAMLPLGAVSGDAFDVVVAPGGAVSLVLLDVTGHGNGAGFVAASVIAAVRQGLQLELPLSYLFSSIESHVLGGYHAEPMPVALSIARFDPRSGQLEFVNAGMPPTLLIEPNETRSELASTAPPVGMIPGRLPRRDVVSIADRAVLMMATDGLSGPAGTDDGLRELWPRIQTFVCAEALSRSHVSLVEALVREHLYSLAPKPTDDASLLVGALSRLSSKGAL